MLKDAEENDNRIAAMQRIQEEVNEQRTLGSPQLTVFHALQVQQALADEVASKLGEFASQLVPFLSSTQDQLIDRVVEEISGYQVYQR